VSSDVVSRAPETLQAPPRPAGTRLSLALRRHRRGLLGSASVVIFLVVWQLVGARNLISADLISYPTQVVSTAAQMAASGELGSNALVSLQEFLYGFVPAVALGIALGLAMGQFRRVRYLLDPLIMAFYTAPRIALIPVLVIWFGVGIESKVAVVFLGAILPVIVNTMAGVQQIDPLWVRAVRSFGASEWQVVTKVVLPGALPAVMAGVRLGLGRAIIGVVVGEMYVAVAGVGRLVQVYSGAGRAAELIVLVVLIAAFGFACITGLRLIEERIAPWRRELES
jgi:ABC-type nitrate/sulfonate/bicarbonate transport system permease component